MSRESKLPKIIAIIGATATGKTALAVRLARELNGEIVSADSRQVYRGMDLGTGKDLAEYGSGRDAVPYYLIDVAKPQQQFDLNSYQKQAYAAIDDILRRGKLPILVGGSGLYVQAIVDGYVLSETASAKTATSRAELTLKDLQSRVKQLDPAFFKKLNPSDQKNHRRLLRYLEILSDSQKSHDALHGKSKPRYDCLVIGVEASIETIRKNIKKRLNDRFKAGMIEEVERLHDKGLSWERLEAFGLEYKFIAQYLQALESRARGNNRKKEGNAGLKDMQDKLAIASGQFAKRQLSWFRRWEKQGREVLWLRKTAYKKVAESIRLFLEN